MKLPKVRGESWWSRKLSMEMGSLVDLTSLYVRRTSAPVGAAVESAIPNWCRPNNAGRWRGSSSITSKPTPRSIGRCPASRWPPAPWATTGSRRVAGEERTTRRDLFGAAYEDVTYRDSTDDGVEGEIFEDGEDATDFELVGEGERIVNRLNFLTTVAQLWKLSATAAAAAGVPDRDDVLAGWLGSGGRRTTGSCWTCWPRCTAIGFRRRAARTSRWWNTTAAAASRKRCWRRSSTRASRRAMPRGWSAR